MRRGDDMEGKDDRAAKDWRASKEGPSSKTIVAIGAIVIVVIFALQNMEGADIDVFFWDMTLPVWVVIAIAAGLGFVVGWLLGRSSGRRRAIEKLTD